MGYDAFGLPAEQYAVQTGQHPRVTTEANIANMRRQLRALGLGHDPRRGVATTDVDYYRWTQWIFLQLFDSWYDEAQDRARPIDELLVELEEGTRAPESDANPDALGWHDLDGVQRRAVVDSYRLAYLDDALVNWCPALGTVLANEEVTADGRSERGNHPVFRRPLKQWMLRITTYADRLLADLDLLDWPESIKLMQRNWIGRSVGAEVSFPVEEHTDVDIDVFTTRPDTLFGATYMVLAPEHPLVDVIAPDQWPTDSPFEWRGTFGLDKFPAEAVRLVPRVRGAEVGARTSGRRPREDRRVHRRVRQEPDQRLERPDLHRRLRAHGLRHRGDHGGARARPARLRVRRRVRPPRRRRGASARRVVRSARALARRARRRSGPRRTPATASAWRRATTRCRSTGSRMADAKDRIIGWLEEAGAGEAAVTYKLRDWLFSRQRYWGEPFPIVYDTEGVVHALPESMLPVELPDITDFEPAHPRRRRPSVAARTAARARDRVDVPAARPG